MTKIVIQVTINEDQAMPKRNPIAQDLRTPKYAPRIVKSKKVYDRKVKEWTEQRDASLSGSQKDS